VRVPTRVGNLPPRDHEVLLAFPSVCFLLALTDKGGGAQVDITICLPVRGSDVLVTQQAREAMYTHEYKVEHPYKYPTVGGGGEDAQAE
jgi:hypothetical protein